jgi:hypothetical protein
MPTDSQQVPRTTERKPELVLTPAGWFWGAIIAFVLAVATLLLSNLSSQSGPSQPTFMPDGNNIQGGLLQNQNLTAPQPGNSK